MRGGGNLGRRLDAPKDGAPMQLCRQGLTEEAAADVESAIAVLRLGPGPQMPAMLQSPTGPAGSAPPSLPPPPKAPTSALALPPPTSAPPPTTPVRKRNSDGACPPPQVLCAPVSATQGPSQDLLPSAVQAAATPPCEALCSSLLDVTPT
eukprot:603041-Amphidinium_carterae.1